MQSHELGCDCWCKRLKCFENTSAQERQYILNAFNQLESIDAQNSHLAGLIAVLPVLRRRSRKPSIERHDATYRYKVRVKRENAIPEIAVCSSAFTAMHGITKLIHIQTSLKHSGIAPVDKRGTCFEIS